MRRFIALLAVVLLFWGCSEHNHTFISPVEPNHENLDHHQGCPNESGRCHDTINTMEGVPMG